MATHATPDNVKDLGFTPEMFAPRVETDADMTKFIRAILDENVTEVKDAIGSTAYDDAANLDTVRIIEKYLAAAELSRIRAAILRGLAIPDGPTGAEEYTLAEHYEERAAKAIDRLTGRVGVAYSVEKHSHFTQDKV